MPQLARIEAPASIELWRVDLRVEPTSGELALLSADEQARAARFVFPHDRRRFRAAHVALRRLLAARTGRAAQALAFSAGPFGKPSLTGSAPTCAFNLSHSADVALIALAPSIELGVDVEVLRVVDDALDLAARNFSGAESAQLRSTAATERDRAFLRCWTRKEACLKAIGSGLSIAPETFEAGLDPRPRVVRIATASSVVSVEVHSLDDADGVIGAIAWISQPS